MPLRRREGVAKLSSLYSSYNLCMHRTLLQVDLLVILLGDRMVAKC